MKTGAEKLGGYVPAMLLWLAACPAAPEVGDRRCSPPSCLPTSPDSHLSPNTLSERGPAGAEALSDALNAFFGELLEIIDAHGGEQ